MKYIILALTLLSACGATARQKAITISYVSLQTAETTFVEWDRFHQRQIVEHATSLEDGKQKLEAYRAKRQEVVLGFSVAWSALAAASLYDEPTWMAAALEAASKLYALIKELQHG